MATMAPIVSKKQKNKKKPKHTLKDLKSLGHDLLSSRSHINNLPILLTFVSPTSPPQYVVESILSLHSFFAPLLPQLPSSSSLKRPRNDDEADDNSHEVIYRTWVRSKFDEFVKLLIGVLVAEEPEDALKEVVLDTLMELVKLGNEGAFNSAIYHRLLHTILYSTTPVDILSDLLASIYFKYIDVRYYTLISVERLVRTLETKDMGDGGKTENGDDDGSHSKESLEVSLRRIHYILSRIAPLEKLDESSKHEMWSGSDENKQLKGENHSSNVLSPITIAKKMKLKFTKAWLSFLRLPLPLDVYKEVLSTLHEAVISNLSNPIMLCDFLTRSYDIGGVVSVMALNSLFILMTQHGLEYPNFYEKLYALLEPSIFMAKHRARFFQLLDSCLKSPMLPAYLAASFAKRLSRLSLSAPPSGSLVIIALIHNLLRRHPSINCLVHREIREETREKNSAVEEYADNARDKDGKDKPSKKPGVDHFNNDECDPMKSNAMKSSLWEIDTLRHHYCPPVSRFVLSLENDLTVRAKTTELNIRDFSSASYGTIFGDEMRRRVKQVPLAFYEEIPTTLFSESEFAGWTFKYDEHSKEKDEDSDASAKLQQVECS